MGWKDLFYFQEQDKRAIIALLSLIFILGGVYLFTKNRGETSTDEQVIALAQFDEFQKQLIPSYSAPKQEAKAGEKSSPPASKTKLSEGQTLDINSVNAKALKKIPGVGDTFAKRILEYRELLGGFTNIEQLLEVKGISSKKFENISPFLIIKKSNRKIKINSSSRINHPYISDKQAESITQYRNTNGKIQSINDIASIEEFTPRDIDRLEKYIAFN